MTYKASTIIVSNRLPVSVSRGKSGELVFESSSGGLATAMSSLEADNKLWVGWPGINAETLTDNERIEITEELQKQGCFPVFLTASEVDLYYEGYANDTLWPLFHYFQNVARLLNSRRSQRRNSPKKTGCVWLRLQNFIETHFVSCTSKKQSSGLSLRLVAR